MRRGSTEQQQVLPGFLSHDYFLGASRRVIASPRITA